MIELAEPDSAPTLEEQIGRAVGAGGLVMRQLQGEGALLRIAALGAAGLTLELSSTSDRAALGAIIASWLWRMKYGSELTAETARVTVRSFGDWLGQGVPWQREPAVTRPELLYPFSARVIFEWLVDRCGYCGGTGVQELTRGNQVRRTRRFGDPRIRHVRCHACAGTCRPTPVPADRADALHIALDEYRRHWPQRFDVALAWLAGIARRLNRPLRYELERRRVAPQ